MQTFEPFERNKFHELLVSLGVPSTLDETFLHELHAHAIEGLATFIKDNPTQTFRYMNPVVLTLYCLHEHAYFAGLYQADEVLKMQQDEVYITRIVSAAIDKYLTNEHLEFRETAVKSRFFPPMTTLKMYVNTVTGLLSGFQGKQPAQTLLTDFMKKCFSLTMCAIDLLISGFETEAFSTWRTLHESEAILLILYRNQHVAIEAYLHHIQYGIAFHHLIPDKSKNDAIFIEIKEAMRSHDLKSKDMKKFIEYGWLYALAADNDNMRLNFRDGVQVRAGLERYHKAYEMSSEITHSSPLLIYSKRQTFYDLTLVYLYETFFRLEGIFSEAYVKWLTPEAQARYRTMREIYDSQLHQFHKIEGERLLARRQAK